MKFYEKQVTLTKESIGKIYTFGQILFGDFRCVGSFEVALMQKDGCFRGYLNGCDILSDRSFKPDGACNSASIAGNNLFLYELEKENE